MKVIVDETPLFKSDCCFAVYQHSGYECSLSGVRQEYCCLKDGKCDYLAEFKTILEEGSKNG